MHLLVVEVENLFSLCRESVLSLQGEHTTPAGRVCYSCRENESCTKTIEEMPIEKTTMQLASPYSANAKRLIIIRARARKSYIERLLSCQLQFIDDGAVYHLAVVHRSLHIFIS